MSRQHSHINTAKEILSKYNGEEPLASFLKKFFSSKKKYGSKDRKQITHLCYCYFRMGKMKLDIPVEEKILTALFLCSDQPNEILAALKPEWNDKCELPINQKLLIIPAQPGRSGGNYSLLIGEVFPWKNELSEGLGHEKFCESFFIQPDLFIRLRPGQEKLMVNKLQNAKLDVKFIAEDCLALPNTSKVDEYIELDQEAVIQDLSSQKTNSFFRNAFALVQNDTPAVWDCCAGSGGKSIMAYDINPKIKLTVTDVRESILINLKERFRKAGIKHYASSVVDLVSETSKISDIESEIIICDAPCTGSGTWSRTPEQLYFFDDKRIEEYSRLQKRIVSNVIPDLQPGGAFIYITCSVFKKENEEVVEFIQENSKLKLKQMEVLPGYEKKADTMFVAVLNLPMH